MGPVGIQSVTAQKLFLSKAAAAELAGAATDALEESELKVADLVVVAVPFGELDAAVAKIRAALVDD